MDGAPTGTGWMTKKDEGQCFTFSMHVLDSAHVHFSGAAWPTVQVEKKMDAVPTVNPWKRRLMGMMKVDAAERKNEKYDRSIHNARDARADPNQEGDVRNREGIAKMEMERSAERRRNAETRLERGARLDRVVRRWIDHSVKITLWQFSANWAEAARVAEREKMLEWVKARKTKREADRAVLVRCSMVVRQVTNRGSMRRFLMQFAGNLTAARKQSRDALTDRGNERDTGVNGKEVGRSALIRFGEGLARWRGNRDLLRVLRQLGANFSAARSQLRRRRRNEERMIQEEAVLAALDELMFKHKLRLVSAAVVRAQVQELEDTYMWLSLDWVEGMLLQVKGIRAIITGFVAGRGWQGMKAAVLQFGVNWAAAVELRTEQAEAEKWLRAAVAGGCLASLVVRCDMRALMAQCVHTWAAVVGELCSRPSGTQGKKEGITGQGRWKFNNKRNGKKKKNKMKKATQLAPLAHRTGTGRLKLCLKTQGRVQRVGDWAGRSVPPSAVRDEPEGSGTHAGEEVPMIRCDR